MSEMGLRSLVVTLCLSLAFSAALEKPTSDDAHKDRVITNQLSDEDHYKGEEHNVDYDHEAFLGEDEARIFDELTPEQSIERLKKIVSKIDKDADGFVTEEELRAWIDYNQKKHVTEDVRQQWRSHNPEDKNAIAWDEYKKIVYGFMENMDPEELENDSEGMSYKEMLRRDERRWKAADQDDDGALSFEEFTHFLHPEDATHMRDIVITETMEDVDADKDGKISINEYIGDMYKGDLEDDEPEWIANEREQFNNFRDKDKSGFMEIEEVRDWILPPDYDHATAEAKHLVHEADGDGDGQLTEDEVVAKYDLFVGSQVTEFGEALLRHDEF